MKISFEDLENVYFLSCLDDIPNVDHGLLQEEVIIKIAGDCSVRFNLSSFPVATLTNEVLYSPKSVSLLGSCGTIYPLGAR